MNKKRRISRFERYLHEEIGIEFKACLYFFSILFFYAVYRIAEGELEAEIIHMAEMIFLAYGMGYAQEYLLSNFDEGERLQFKEILYLCFCSAVYAAVSFVCRWFERNIAVSLGFFLYMVLVYVSAFLVYKFRRDIDAKMLNDDLKAFQERRKK